MPSAYNNKKLFRFELLVTQRLLCHAYLIILFYILKLGMENYNQSDSTQRWVMEYNTNAGGYYIRGADSGRYRILVQIYLEGIAGEEALWTSRVTENVGTLWKLHSAGPELVGKYIFYRKYVKRDLFELEQRRSY